MNFSPDIPKFTLNVLLADDDKDDRFFFINTLKKISLQTELVTVADGEELMGYLRENLNSLPDVIFLDINMPKKNGAECLTEIKKDPRLKKLPVVIYSTSLYEEVADVLFENGAHYYIRKTDYIQLEKILSRFLPELIDSNFSKPPRSKFIIDLIEV